MDASVLCLLLVALAAFGLLYCWIGVNTFCVCLFECIVRVLVYRLGAGCLWTMLVVWVCLLCFELTCLVIVMVCVVFCCYVVFP